MSILKFNKESKFTAKASEEAVYVKLQDLYESSKDTAMVIHSFFKNTKSKFGENFIAFVTPEGGEQEFLVNLPKHLNNTIESIMADEETVDEINACKAGFKVYSYEDKLHNKTCYSINFVEI